MEKCPACKGNLIHDHCDICNDPTPEGVRICYKCDPDAKIIPIPTRQV